MHTRTLALQIQQPFPPRDPCAFFRFPPTIRLPARLLMPLILRPYRRFPLHCAVTYNVALFQGKGTIWNLSCTGWRLSGDLPMRPGETLSLTVTLPNEQHILIPEAVVRWSRGEEFAVENVNVVVERHTHARLQDYMKRLVQEPAENVL
ncbi:MAG: PilZ domain-containing protein [Nitrospirae bacterium]|nr:MAG: PilZ domain-containing protein [Nitrospirota bacterium]